MGPHDVDPDVAWTPHMDAVDLGWRQGAGVGQRRVASLGLASLDLRQGCWLGSARGQGATGCKPPLGQEIPGSPAAMEEIWSTPTPPR